MELKPMEQRDLLYQIEPFIIIIINNYINLPICYRIIIIHTILNQNLFGIRCYITSTISQPRYNLTIGRSKLPIINRQFQNNLTSLRNVIKWLEYQSIMVRQQDQGRRWTRVQFLIEDSSRRCSCFINVGLHQPQLAIQPHLQHIINSTRHCEGHIFQVLHLESLDARGSNVHCG